MITVVSEKPYYFTPPRESWFWPAFMKTWLVWYLNRRHGITSTELRGTEHLQQSLNAGHGILLAPNHCRPCDPMVLGMLIKKVGPPFFTMASAHLFREGRLQPWLLPRVGAFSVHREGLDREALKTAIEILKTARRPLVVFPEGVITRTNDHVTSLMDGVVFMARAAAKQRAPKQVVIHPVAIRYTFHGDITASLTPVLDNIEQRLSWKPQRDLPLIERIVKVGLGLLALKEIEYLGEAQSGETHDRLERFTDRLLVPLENEWLKGARGSDVTARVKLLRTAILRDMVGGSLPDAERARRWKQLDSLDLVQLLLFFPPDYLGESPTPERLMETVERYEEGLIDRTTIHRPIHVTITVGEALPVSPVRDRSADVDPLTQQIKERLETMLGIPKSGS